jgi:hypothetical protein
LPPFVFFAGATATVLAAAGGTVVVLVADSKHSDFVNAGCMGASPPASTDCKGQASTGRTLDIVGNSLFLGAAVLGLGTMVAGLFLVEWRGKAAISMAPVPGGAVGAYRVDF